MTRGLRGVTSTIRTSAPSVRDDQAVAVQRDDVQQLAAERELLVGIGAAQRSHAFSSRRRAVRGSSWPRACAGASSGWRDDVSGRRRAGSGEVVLVAACPAPDRACAVGDRQVKAAGCVGHAGGQSGEEQRDADRRARRQRRDVQAEQDRAERRRDQGRPLAEREAARAQGILEVLVGLLAAWWRVEGAPRLRFAAHRMSARA